MIDILRISSIFIINQKITRKIHISKLIGCHLLISSFAGHDISRGLFEIPFVR